MKAHEAELIGSGLSLCAAICIFHVIDPYTAGKILVEKLLKIACYCLILLGFNLWMRVNNRLRGLDPYAPGAMREHIKMTSFFLFCFALMEAALFIENI